ncbi:MAG: hypothetical protein ACLFNL_05000 [Bacteroidales bacterium]
MKYIEGFSKHNRNEKLRLIAENTQSPEEFIKTLNKSRYQYPELQSKLESFSENTIANYHLPYGIAPNFLIDNKLYHIPMVIEESSVIAAAAKSAKFWYSRGGFQTTDISVSKKGQIHFFWYGEKEEIIEFINKISPGLQESLKSITSQMEKRGGGIQSIKLNDKTSDIPHYFELDFTIETADSMGANFINSVLESAVQYLIDKLTPETRKKLDINMAILSNHTPESKISMKVECPVEKLAGQDSEMSGKEFAEQFYKAVEIAKKNVSRAVTHNKGIMNGIDAVVLATGNDYRAVEAAAHAYAAHTGKYTALTDCSITNNIFSYQLTVPLSIGSTGGLTRIHPLAEKSLEVLDNPSAKELMKIIAAAGLANNFGAITALITTGIQKGHMKLHLENILLNFNISDAKKEQVRTYFSDRKVSYREVENYIRNIL